ncbi:MAG: DUF5989 family protein [Bdellovibrionota bacterium]
MASTSNVRMIWDFLRVRKKWWLLPIVVFSLLVSLAIISTSQTVYAPFIYTLF